MTEVAHLTQLGSKKTEYMAERPNSGMLETFKSPYGRSQFSTVEIEFPEFTSLCPITGQPDFANFVIDYCPRDLCVESKSLKLYFFAYRSEGAFMEKITNQVAKDLFEAMDPWWVKVHGQFRPRGGMFVWPHVIIRHPEYEG